MTTNKSEYASIGYRIKFLRTHLKISQRHFAQKVSLSQSVLSSYENGKTSVPANCLINICEKYNLDLNFFDYRKPLILQNGKVLLEGEVILQ